MECRRSPEVQSGIGVRRPYYRQHPAGVVEHRGIHTVEGPCDETFLVDIVPQVAAHYVAESVLIQAGAKVHTAESLGIGGLEHAAVGRVERDVGLGVGRDILEDAAEFLRGEVRRAAEETGFGVHQRLDGAYLSGHQVHNVALVAGVDESHADGRHHDQGGRQGYIHHRGDPRLEEIASRAAATASAADKA